MTFTYAIAENKRLRAEIKNLKKELAIAKALAYTSGMESDPKVTGSQGGKKRMGALSSEQRQALAKKAAEARWGKSK